MNSSLLDSIVCHPPPSVQKFEFFPVRLYCLPSNSISEKLWFRLSDSAVCHPPASGKISISDFQTLLSATHHRHLKKFEFFAVRLYRLPPTTISENISISDFQTLPSATRLRDFLVCGLCRLPLCHHFLRFLTIFFQSLPPCHQLFGNF